MTTLPDPSDDDLLRRIRAGDEEAFTLLYRRRQGGIYRFALRMSGSPSVAEEVTQEVFMALLHDSNRYDPSRGSVAGFLYGVGRNHVLRSIERDRRFVPLGDCDSESAVAQMPNGADASQEDPLGDLTRTESIERVRQAVLALPLRYREVVLLCDLEELAYADAAQALGCAIGTVRSRLHRARSLLLAKLRAQESAATTRGGTESGGRR